MERGDDPALAYAYVRHSRLLWRRRRSEMFDLHQTFTEDELVRKFAAQTMRFPTGREVELLQRRLHYSRRRDPPRDRQVLV